MQLKTINCKTTQIIFVLLFCTLQLHQGAIFNIRVSYSSNLYNCITSRLERIEEKVDRESRNLQRLLKKIEKRKACIWCFNIIIISQPKKTEALY